MSTNGEKFSRGESFSTAALLNRSANHVFDAPGGVSFRLNPDGYQKASSAEKDKVASFVNKWMQKNRDPAAGVPGAAPLFGQDVAPHAMTFASKIGSQAKTYLPSDESLETNPNDALLMRKDLGIMECLEIRQRMSALLDWSIVPEDSKSPAQKSVAAELTKIIKRIKRFTEYRRCLMDAIWIGRSAIQHTYGHGIVSGKMYCYPRSKHADATGWKHIHGDKIVFRYDDGEKMHPGAFADQMGIRVSPVLQKDSRLRGIQDLEYTNSGAAIFLSPAERQTIICHKHMIEDAEYSNPRKAGRIHGVGIRDRIYNEWFLKQELLGFLIEYMERSAGGIEIYEYPSGDEAAKASVMEAARNRMAFGRNQIFFPKPLGMDAGVYDLRIVEPGFAGIDMLLNVLDKYFGHRIKRYIIGQTLSTEADATGLGSSVADFQKDSLSQIVRYDSCNLEESITHELVRPIQLANWPETEAWQFEYKAELESDNAKEKLDAMRTAWEMGCGIPEKDVAETVGVSLDNPNEKMLRNMSAGGGGAPGMPGMPGAGGIANGMLFPAGTGFGNQVDAAHEHLKAAGEVKRLRDGVIEHVSGKLGDGSGEAPSSPAVSPDKYSREWTAKDEKNHPREAAGAPGGTGGQFKSRQHQMDSAFDEANSQSRLPGYVSMSALRKSSAMQGVSREEQDKLIREFRGKGYSLSQAEGRNATAEEAGDWLQDVPDPDAPPLSRPNAFSGMTRTDNWNPPVDPESDEPEMDDEPEAEEPDEEELAEKARQEYVASLPTHVRAIPRIQSSHKTPVGEYRIYLKSWQEDGEAQHESTIMKDGQIDSEFAGDTAEEALADANEAMGEILKDVEKFGQVEKSGQDRSFNWSVFHDGKGGFGYRILDGTGKETWTDDGFNSVDDAESDALSTLEQETEPVKLESSSFPAVKAGKIRLDKTWVDADMVEQYVPENIDDASAEQIVDQMLAEHTTEVVNESDMEKLRGKYETLVEKMLDKNRGNENSTIDGEGWEDWFLQAAGDHALREIKPALIEHVEELLEEIAQQRMLEDDSEDSPEEKQKQIDDFLESVKDRPVKRRQFAEQISRVMDMDFEEAERIVLAKFGPENYQRRSDRLLEEAASMTDTSPTEAQREAGNYAKGVYSWKGMEIAIENPRGSVRTGVGSSGREWSRKMASHYGYFRRTAAVDGDNLDVFIGRHPESDFVLVIKQIDQDGKFDEFKVVVGCLNRKQAKKLYLANYPKGWKCGPAAGMTVELFKKWIAKGGPVKEKSLAKVEKYSREFEPDNDSEKNTLIAEILQHFYGDSAGEMLDHDLDQYQRIDDVDYYSWVRRRDEEEHPRNKAGRFTKKGSAENTAAVHSAIDDELKSGERSPESAKRLVDHLSQLSVKELSELKKKYGVSASGVKAELVEKIAKRLDSGRRADKSMNPVVANNATKKDPEKKEVHEDFIAAFEKLDKASGFRNYLKLIDLRRELPHYSREDLNKGILDLCRARHFGLEGSEGSMVKLTQKEKDAGIMDGGSLLVYVRRRTTGKIPLEQANKSQVKPKVSVSTSQKASSQEKQVKEDFVSAFERLDKASGFRNYIKLADLRRELSGYSREEFDSAILDLNRARQFGMEGSEGSTVKLTDEERAAGIKDGSELLVYVRRRV